MRTRSLLLWLTPALVLTACGTTPVPSAITPPDEFASASSHETEGAASDGPSPADDLGAVPWWATELLGFGVIPEAPPDPDPAVQPGSFRQLRIGTLDGRVTAVLALHSEWAHSYVAGPYGTDVLVANDTGTTSEVFLVSALDGARTDLFSSPDIVAAAAMGDGGRSIYYVELSRGGGLDRGLWRRTIDGGGAPIQVLPGPLGDDNRDPRVWWVTADPLEGRVVVQACFGQVRCTTRAVDPATGEADEETALGWPLGARGTTFFAGGLGPSDAAHSWNLATGETALVRGASDSVPVLVGDEWRFVRGEPGVPEGATLVLDGDGEAERLPGLDRSGSVLEPLGERRGVALPDGWVLRWPPIRIQELAGAMGPPGGDGQLIHIRTSRRVDLPRVELAVPLGTPCEVPVPSLMPSGLRPGFGVVELVDGAWTVRWGLATEAVIVGVDQALGDASGLAGGAPVDVRGHLGRAVVIGDEGVGMTAFAWTEGECAYTVWMPLGTSIDETIRYAETY